MTTASPTSTETLASSPAPASSPRATPLAAIAPDSFPEPLRDLAAKVRDGERLDEADALLCFETPHVLHLGRLADAVRRTLHGNRAFYNINRHINPTNVCVYTYNCKFCGFAAMKGEDHAWEMSHEEVYERAARQGGNRVTELHIVGGLHPELRMSWYVEMLRGLKERFPDVHLKAFTAIEIGWFAKLEKLSIEEVLVRLREAGLGSLPGGGAEIFHPEVREVICDGKLDAGEWVEVHRVAHRLGIPSNCTMLYGHVETYEDRVDHLALLRDLQDETGGFLAYIPLAYHPDNNELGEQLGRTGTATTGFDDLKNLAVGRLFLDNIRHIKTHWIMNTPKVSQIALHFGVDDLEGTVRRERIYHEAGAGTPEGMTFAEIVRLIRDAGKRPVERNVQYEEVREW